MFGLSIPAALAGAFGDQDGLFPSACGQYRGSMNHVAAWAEAAGLMEYTGAECVPREVSLLESHLAGNHGRLAASCSRPRWLPRGTLELRARPTTSRGCCRSRTVPPASIVALPVFRILTGDELEHAGPSWPGPSRWARPSGSSSRATRARLAVRPARGRARGPDPPRTDDTERVLAELQPGSVVGEVAFLTGQPRTATVRAVDGAIVYEVGPRQYGPILAGTAGARRRAHALDDLAPEVPGRDARRYVPPGISALAVMPSPAQRCVAPTANRTLAVLLWP